MRDLLTTIGAVILVGISFLTVVAIPAGVCFVLYAAGMWILGHAK